MLLTTQQEVKQYRNKGHKHFLKSSGDISRAKTGAAHGECIAHIASRIHHLYREICISKSHLSNHACTIPWI